MKRLLLLQLIQECGRLEVLRDIVVQASNDFVNGLLPSGLSIFSSRNGLEKLPECLFDNKSKMLRHLRRNKLKLVSRDSLKGLMRKGI